MRSIRLWRVASLRPRALHPLRAQPSFSRGALQSARRRERFSEHGVHVTSQHGTRREFPDSGGARDTVTTEAGGPDEMGNVSVAADHEAPIGGVRAQTGPEPRGWSIVARGNDV